ncbi:MAG TPA: MgtC/SapB family protein [Candidatus Dormibacteraeota bacterium]|nr:MgtC/SapB family protein [Candidatus Dormibacteraeota bacterium]
MTNNDIIARLLLAAVLGAVVGLERDLRRKPAGLRTAMFICMGSALFTIVSSKIAIAVGDTGATRIASNIVQGIGFLGAGAIVRDRGNVAGLTTAASMWAMAAVGMAVAGGLFKVAIFVVGCLLFALVVLGWVEDRLNLKARMMMFRITAADAKDLLPRTQEILQEYRVKPSHFQTTRLEDRVVVEFDADVSHYQEQSILRELDKLHVRSEVMPLDARKE